MPSELVQLNEEVVACQRCPRLIDYCRRIGLEKRRAYLEWDYWAKPVPGFGDPEARVLILGLAPGAHGSNRTGRPFTGDGSGNFMFPVLHETGFASQPNAVRREDGLTLKDAYITAVVRCAPPGNKPALEEIGNCADFLDRELRALKRIKVVVALGKIGFDGYLDHLKRKGIIASRGDYSFGHGAEYLLQSSVTVLASYHPSMQNTLTGKLTKEMFKAIFVRAKSLLV